MTEIEKELERFIASGKATTKVNSGRFQTTHIDPLKIAKHFAQWQKEQDFNDFTRLRKSWYEEGRIDGKFEGLSDDVRYQQGFHDAKEQMMKDAIDATALNSDYPTRLELHTKLSNVNAMDEVKVIIIKE